MKKLNYLLILIAFTAILFSQSVTAQVVTVTNPGNVGPTPLSGTYASLADAITALNTKTSISGPVTITLNSGNPQTAPAGGYVISAILSGASATNTVTFEGSGNTITAGLQTAGSQSDAIFKIVGSDWVIIQNFTMQENSGNTVITPIGSQTMTEYGVALFPATATNGAQNNTIQNNNISLSSLYPNAIGIMSTSSNSYTHGTLEATSTSGTNSNNKFYNNTINNVAYGMYFICPPITASLFESGIDVGGTSTGTGNTITFGNATTATFTTLNRFSSILPAGICFRNGGFGNNVRFNNITSNSLAYPQSSGLGGIVTTGSTAPTGVTYTTNWSNNTITLSNLGTTAITGIDFGYGLNTGTIISNNNNITLNQTTSAAVSAAINGIKANYTTATNTLNENTITVNQSPTTTGSLTSSVTGINAAGVGTTVNVNSNVITFKQAAPTGSATYGAGAITYINVAAGSGTVNVNYNHLLTTGSSLRTTGTTYGINHGGTFTTAFSCSYNNINIDRSGASATSGTFYATYSNSSSSITNYNMNYNTIVLNSISNGTTAGIYNTDGGSPTKNFNNNNITIIGSGTTVNGMYLGYGTCNAANNEISLTSSQVSPTIIGIATSTTATLFNINNNAFTTLSATAASTSGPTIAAIRVASGTGNTIYSNTISTATTGAGSGNATIGGIEITGGTSTNVYKNKIYGLSTTCSGASTRVSGITISGGGTGTGGNTVYNNFIGNLTAPNSTNPNSVIGINITSTTATSTNNIYYNTVYLSGTGGTNFGSSGIFHTASTTATTATLNLRNNIIVNNCTPQGTGLVVAYRRSAGTTDMLNNYASTSNNNLFFAGVLGGSANQLIYSDGTSTAQTISAYKNGVFTAGTIAPRDAASFTELPNFLSTNGADATFLHIATTTATQIESGGQIISGITDDYDGQARYPNPGYPDRGDYPATAPDVGADEFAGIPSDQAPPIINYTLLGNGIVESERTLMNFATITDVSGVNQNPGTAPRIYFKKSTDNNEFNDNTSNSPGWKYVETNNYSSPNSFVINYSLLYGGSGVSVGDVIQYFVVAQDNAPVPNVGINSGIFANPQASVDLQSNAFPISGTINSYTIMPPISGFVTVGTGGDYSSLTGASGLFATINSRVVTGNITASIISDLSESGENALNQWSESGAGGYTLTIQPNSATNRNISGSFAGGLIRLNGADRVTFDGRSGGSGNYLTISNTNTSGSAVFQIISLGTGQGSNNVTIRNCNISAGSISATTYGIFAGSSTLGTAADDNDNLSILNNVITKAYNGIWAKSSSTGAGVLNGLNIIGNVIGSSDPTNFVVYRGIDVQGADAPIISQNEVFNQQTSSFLNVAAIDLGQYVTNAIVERNKIYGLRSTSTSGYGAYGINISSSTGTNNISIYNNLIYDIITANYSTTSTIWNAFGIRITGGTNHKIYYNTINLYGNVTSGSSAGMSANMVITAATPGLDVRNNIFVNTQSFGVSGSFAYNIFLGTTGITFSTINRNDYFGTSSGTTTYRVGYDGTNPRTALTDWQAYTGQDGNSRSDNPQFVSNTDLRPSLVSPVLNAGVPISGINNDYLGAQRGTTYPNTTIGAYEYGVDALPPVITYTPLTSTTSTENRTLENVNITDASGVPTSGILQPRIYYRKNAGGWVSTQGTLVSGSGTNGNWNFTINNSLVGGVAAYDVISYYIIAQDVASPPNIGSNPSGVVATDVNNVSTHPSSPNQYTILGTLAGGTYAIGPNGPYSGYDGWYSTITAAALALNTNVISGNLIFELQSDYVSSSETFPITFNQFNVTGGDWAVTFRPAGNASGLLTAGDPGSANSLIVLNGTDRITFDGRPGGSGSGNEWTIRNSRTSTTIGETFRMLNDVTFVELRNLTIEGNNSTTTGGVISVLGTTGVKGNDRITIQNNNIKNFTGGNPNIAILVAAQNTTTLTNDTITITNNNIYDFGNNIASTNPIGIYLGGVNFATITGNSIYRTTSYSAQGLAMFISIGATGSGPGHNISNNFLGGSAPNATGTYTVTTSTSGLYVIDIYDIASQSTPTTVSGNVIRGFNFTSAADPTSNTIYFCGVFNRSSAGSVDITNNLIGDTTVNAETSPSITFNANGASSSYFSVVEGIDVRAGTGQISGNKIGGIKMIKASTRNCSFTGITHSTAGLANITNNLIGSRNTEGDKILIGNRNIVDSKISNNITNYESNVVDIKNKNFEKEIKINNIAIKEETAVDFSLFIPDNKESMMKKPGDNSNDFNKKINAISENSENTDVVTNNKNDMQTDNVIIPNISQETAGSVVGISISVGGTISGNVVANIKMNSVSPTSNQFFGGISISNTTITSNNNILTNNIVRNIFNNATGGTSYGLNCATTTTGTLTCTGNTVSNITLTSPSSGTATFAGIVNSSSGSYNISNNTIHTISSNSNSTLSTNGHNVFTGIYQVNSSASTSNLISNNVIRDITCNPSTATTQIRMQGIFNNSSTSVGTVSSNRVYNFNTNTTNTASEVNGYYSYYGAQWTYINNVFDLGGSISNDIIIYAVRDYSDNNTGNWWNNTFRVSGTVSGGAVNTAVYFRQSTASTVTSMQNNNFINTRTGGTGVHMVLNNSIGSAGWTLSNYNNLYAVSGIVGRWATTTDLDFAAWKTNSSQDSYSVSGAVVFGSSDILIPDINNASSWVLSGNGNQIPGNNSDINGNARSTTLAGGAPDIGAYEFGVPTVEPNTFTTNITEQGIYNIFVNGRQILSLNFSGLGTISSVDVKFYSGVNPPGVSGYPGAEFMNGYFTITPNTGASGYTYDITYFYSPPQRGTISSESDIRLSKSDNGGVNWDSYLTPGTGAGQYILNTTDKTIKVHGLTSFSTFTTSNANNPLPLQLSSFTSTVNGRDVKLSWITEKEQNNSGFEIERKLNSDKVWQKIGFVQGKGTKTEPTAYSFTDSKLNTGKYNYRLKQIDYNGNFEYFELSSLVEIGVPKKFDLSQNYPNPFNPITKIDYELPFDSKVTMFIYDITGREMKKIINSEFQSAGYYTLTFDASGLSSGTYLYRIIVEGNGQSFIMTKKMSVVK